METVENIHFVDKVVKSLRTAAVELEELQVQAALGKAEASDKYEEIKKKFNMFIHESKGKYEMGKEKVEDLHTQFDELRVQLALGKAETIDAFKEQKKQLLETIHEIEVKIKSNERLNRMYAFMLLEFEKFKAQLELLEQRFDKGKESATTSFEKGKLEFNDFIEKMKARYSNEDEATRWEHFQGEISEAFSHFKHAFSKP
ncbi:MAG: hypothetical protein HKN89_00715 [Eudoraea sp.]|nr:hypothetical protein [Eudoraea sp.]